ncbi:hypothetical protein J6590_023380 [Homalodisca vitripennis]|nr:hypothetical protein J6590_023380 [Homalodisca vitripennis]
MFTVCASICCQYYAPLFLHRSVVNTMLRGSCIDLLSIPCSRFVRRSVANTIPHCSCINLLSILCSAVPASICCQYDAPLFVNQSVVNTMLRGTCVDLLSISRAMLRCSYNASRARCGMMLRVAGTAARIAGSRAAPRRAGLSSPLSQLCGSVAACGACVRQ